MSRLATIGAMLLTALALGMPISAQESSRPSVLEQLRGLGSPESASKPDDPGPGTDPITLPRGQSELQFRRPGEIPRQLRRAISPCGYEHWLPDVPVKIIRPDADRDRLIAIAPCGSMIAHGTAFTIGQFWEPLPISFTVAASPTGFGITRYPGLLEWHADTRTLTATQFNDVCPYVQVRHTYRYEANDSPFYEPNDFPFILIRIEYRPNNCDPGDDPWLLKWEAPRWDDSK